MNVLRAAVLGVAACVGAYEHLSAECLPGVETYNVDLGESSVSGISSGGYMAVQFHVANSAWMKGAGVYAGGPYYCAENSVYNGIGRCVNGGITQADLQRFLNEANNQAAAGRIDDTENLANNKIWLFHGTRDDGVATQVMDSLKDWYQLAGVPAANIEYVKDFDAGHTWPTKYYFYEEGDGNQCTEPSDYPWLGACDWESARAMLEHIYGPLNPRQSGPLSGQILELDQASCFNNGGYGAPNSMNPKAYLYVPASCAQGDACRLHVAFHGCEMNYDSAPSPYAGDTGPVYGLKFVENSELNQIADTNNMLLLYPQAKKNAGYWGAFNPKGCWDFWNYEGGGVPHTQHGKQMDVVRAMVVELACPPGEECDGEDGGEVCHTATNDEHVSAGRADKETVFFFFSSYSAKGSGDDLGFFGGTSTSLHETSEGHWTQVDSCE